MAAYLNEIPEPEGLDYLERGEATFTPYGGRWLILDAQVDVVEGDWPGSVVLMSSLTRVRRMMRSRLQTRP